MSARWDVRASGVQVGRDRLPGEGEAGVSARGDSGPPVPWPSAPSFVDAWRMLEEVQAVCGLPGGPGAGKGSDLLTITVR